MKHRPEVHAAEKWEVGSDASMRLVRRQDARDLSKEHVPADDSSEFWAELGNLRDYMYIHCRHLQTLFKTTIINVYDSLNTFMEKLFS